MDLKNGVTGRHFVGFLATHPKRQRWRSEFRPVFQRLQAQREVRPVNAK
jgi:hypothetical protein